MLNFVFTCSECIVEGTVSVRRMYAFRNQENISTALYGEKVKSNHSKPGTIHRLEPDSLSDSKTETVLSFDEESSPSRNLCVLSPSPMWLYFSRILKHFRVTFFLCIHSRRCWRLLSLNFKPFVRVIHLCINVREGSASPFLMRSEVIFTPQVFEAGRSSNTCGTEVINQHLESWLDRIIVDMLKGRNIAL